jgi:hypothetical protein
MSLEDELRERIASEERIMEIRMGAADYAHNATKKMRRLETLMIVLVATLFAIPLVAELITLLVTP